MRVLSHEARFRITAEVRNAIAIDPDFMGSVIEAATAGQRDALASANARRSDLERAWVTALLMLNADRITPGLKQMLGRSLVPVLEHYGLVSECQAVRDAHELVTAKAAGEPS